MEIRNTPPPLQMRDQDDSSVIEELCLALREVGVLNAQLPDGQKVRKRIAYVKELHAELEQRDVDPSSRIARLSHETNWDMESLLRDTLAFPDTVPYLAATPHPRCGNCGKAISRKALLALCSPCLMHGLEQLAAGKTDSHLDTCSVCGRHEKGFLVYAYGLEWMNYCRSCLEEERARRDSA
jgi:hypothetical protein